MTTDYEPHRVLESEIPSLSMVAVSSNIGG